ncbi:MAG: type IV secretion protein Rhs [Candidatus Protochlamydia sp.]|nr:type IV secretion protein Rhs [Candidatus Protochlamydia sp.]
MEKHHVENPELQSILKKAYRENAEIGSGSTAAAIRHEIQTGEPVKGFWHSKKGEDLMNSLRKWISNNQNNPNVKPGDLDAAKNVYLDTMDALKNTKANSL